MSLVTLEQLAGDLAKHGGAIVSSKECRADEIALARSLGRLAVRFDGAGFVRRPALWLEMANQKNGN